MRMSGAPMRDSSSNLPKLPSRTFAAAEQLEWLYRLEAEHDNINAALRGAIAVGDAQTVVRLVAAAGWYWWLGGHKAEGMELAIEARAVPGDVDAVARATAFAMVAYFATAGVGDLKKAEPWVREARQLAQTLDNPGPMLRYMIRIWGLVYSDDGLSAASQEGLEALVADEDPWVRADGRSDRSRFLVIRVTEVRPRACGDRACGRSVNDGAPASR